MELPPPHVFACVIDEISSSPTPAGTRIERRRERGVSVAETNSGVVALQTSDQLRDVPGGTRAWLEQTSAPHVAQLPFALRAIERRVWVRRDGIEERYKERFFVVPGLGAVTLPQAPPAPQQGTVLDPTAALVFAGGTAAVLMHEMAGHRAETAAVPLLLPSWLHVTDRPPRHFDDCGLAATARDLTSSAASSFRRWRAIDAPLPRMWDVYVEASATAPSAEPRTCFVIRAIAAGHWNATTEEVSMIVTDAQLLRNGTTEPVQVPTRLTLRASAVTARVTGAAGAVVRAPSVVCGSHGSEIIAGSAACDLFLGEGDA